MKYAKSYIFKLNGSDIIWDTTVEKMIKFEQEEGLNFQISIINVHDISEFQRKDLICEAINLNSLT